MTSHVPGVDPEMRAALERSWIGLLARRGARPERASESFRPLAVRYSEPTRHYHNLEHVREVLLFVDSPPTRLYTEHHDAVLFAAWYHDVVYDSRATDNEEKSSGVAAVALAELGVESCERELVRDLILATREPCARDLTADAEALVDADLSILGAAADRYERYREAIRREYAWLPDEVFRSRRSTFLQRLLALDSIFHTPDMIEHAEEKARRNIRGEIEALRRT